MTKTVCYLFTSDCVFLNLARVTRIASSITVSSRGTGAWGNPFSTSSRPLVGDWLEVPGAAGNDIVFFTGAIAVVASSNGAAAGAKAAGADVEGPLVEPVSGPTSFSCWIEDALVVVDAGSSFCSCEV